jgi:hypothetical protein
VISGTPGYVSGSFTITITATDTGISGDNASESYAIRVNATTALYISTTSLPDAHVGAPYSASLSALNGKSPYTWKRVSGALPKGLKFSKKGTITGKPKASAVTSTFTVKVTDKSHPRQTATATLTINVS